MKITINEILGLLLIITLIIWIYYPLIRIFLKKEKFDDYYSVESNLKKGLRMLMFITITCIGIIFLIGWFILEIGTLSITL